jgi:hypothetical protein
MKGKKQNKQSNKNKNEKNPKIETKYTEFIDTTQDKDTFIIQNVAEDNACFFRSISNGLYHITETDGDSGIQVLYSIGNWKKEINGHNTIKNRFWGYKGSEQTYLATKVQQIAKKWLIQNQTEYVNNIPGYRVVDLVRDSHGFEIDDDKAVMALYDVCYSKFAGLPRMKNILLDNSNYSDIEDNNDDIEYISEDSDHEVFNYCAIDESDDDYIYNDFNEYSEEHHVIENKNPDLREYQQDLQVEYDILSQGNPVIEQENTTSFMDDESDTDNEIDQEMGFTIDTDKEHNELKEKIMEKYNISEIWDRWGSGAEAYALSKCFEVPIIIYAPKRFNFKNGKIENGRMCKDVKPDKNVRFQVLQIWGNEFMGKSPPIELLYRKIRKNIEHYMVLYRA